MHKGPEPTFVETWTFGESVGYPGWMRYEVSRFDQDGSAAICLVRRMMKLGGGVPTEEVFAEDYIPLGLEEATRMHAALGRALAADSAERKEEETDAGEL